MLTEELLKKVIENSSRLYIDKEIVIRVYNSLVTLQGEDRALEIINNIVKENKEKR